MEYVELTQHDAGSYKQYVRSPARYTTIIPEGVSDYVAGPIMCSAATMYTALKASGLRAGQWACFPGGGGGVGVQGVQLAAAMGFKPIVVDTGANRKALTQKAGAVEFVDFKEVEDPCAEVVKLTGGGAHGVFVTAVQAYPVSLNYLGPRSGAVVMWYVSLWYLDWNPECWQLLTGARGVRKVLGFPQTASITLTSSRTDWSS